MIAIYSRFWHNQRSMESSVDTEREGQASYGCEGASNALSINAYDDNSSTREGRESDDHLLGSNQSGIEEEHG